MITCIDTFDYTLVSAGLDEKLFVWDVRMMARYASNLVLKSLFQPPSLALAHPVSLPARASACMMRAHSSVSALYSLLSSTSGDHLNHVSMHICRLHSRTHVPPHT